MIMIYTSKNEAKYIRCQPFFDPKLININIEKQRGKNYWSSAMYPALNNI